MGQIVEGGEREREVGWVGFITETVAKRSRITLYLMRISQRTIWNGFTQNCLPSWLWMYAITVQLLQQINIGILQYNCLPSWLWKYEITIQLLQQIKCYPMYFCTKKEDEMNSK